MKRLILLILCFGVIGPVYAEKSAQDLSREYNLIFQQFLREKIEQLPKGVTVEVILKDKTRVIGTFEGFTKFDDSVWILPKGKFGLFSDDAYDISEIQGIRVMILRSI